MNTKKNSLLLILINFFFVLVAVLILFNFFPKNLFQKKAETIKPTLERIELTIPAKGFIAKQEILYKAPVGGKIKRMRSAPELLVKNDEAVQIFSLESKPMYSVKVKDEGFITFIKDSCEEILSWDLLSKKVFTEEEIVNPPINQLKVSDDQVVEKDDFIFKIVKNNVIHYYLAIDTKDVEKFNIDDNLIFTIYTPRNITADGKIIKKTLLNQTKTLLIFETSFYIEPLINHRKISGSFTFPYITACYIPSKAVLVKKDEKGIDHFFILIKEEKEKKISAKITEIKILGQNSYTKDYVVDNLTEDIEVFRDYSAAIKKYSTSGK